MMSDELHAVTAVRIAPARHDSPETDQVWSATIASSLDSRRTVAPRSMVEYRAALTLARQLAAKDPTNAGWQRVLAFAHYNVGDTLLALGGAPNPLAALFTLVQV